MSTPEKAPVFFENPIVPIHQQPGEVRRDPARVAHQGHNKKKEGTNIQTFSLKNLNLKLENFSNGGPVILKAIVADHPYRDNKRIEEEISGRKVSVVFPSNGYEVLEVKVADPTDALTPLLKDPSRPVYVAFDSFTASIYTMRGEQGLKTGISAKADKVRAIQNPDEIDFGVSK